MAYWTIPKWKAMLKIRPKGGNHLGKLPNNPLKSWRLTLQYLHNKNTTINMLENVKGKHKVFLMWSGLLCHFCTIHWETPLYETQHCMYGLLHLCFAWGCSNDRPPFTSNTNRCSSLQRLARPWQDWRVENQQRRARPPLVTEVRHLTSTAGPDRGPPTTAQPNTQALALF